MTEAEYLTSEDPAAMLQWMGNLPADGTDGEGRPYTVRPSDRKLRLWVEACRQRAGVSDHFDIYNAGLRLAVEYWCGKDGLPLSHADRAAILRCVAGNPWRKVTLPRGATEVRCDKCGRVDPTVQFADMRCLGCGRGIARVVPGHCPWLTPTVLSLAQAAYDERPGRECPRCGGRGWLGGVAPGQTGWIGAPNCPRCNKGRIDDGTLDLVRLAILADALEEAGCPGPTVCGWLPPHPLLAHLRSPGPHVRGCWALSLILGKE